MGSSIILGIFWHFVGAASAACFYAPLKKVKNWSWETMWSIAGLFSWIILTMVNKLFFITRLLGLLWFIWFRHINSGLLIRRNVGSR